MEIEDGPDRWREGSASHNLVQLGGTWRQPPRKFSVGRLVLEEPRGWFLTFAEEMWRGTAMRGEWHAPQQGLPSRREPAGSWGEREWGKEGPQNPPFALYVFPFKMVPRCVCVHVCVGKNKLDIFEVLITHSIQLFKATPKGLFTF